MLGFNSLSIKKNASKLKKKNLYHNKNTWGSKQLPGTST